MPWFSLELLRDPSLPWIAVRTRARSEKRVAAILHHWGVDCWAPTAPLRRRWSDRWKTIEWPMFPGYLLARIPADGWYPLLDIPGVHTVVKRGLHAAEIDPTMIYDVREFARRLSRVDVEPEHVPWFEVGELVVVSDGPFAGVRATVTQADGKRRVSIGMMLLGQGVSVTLPAEALTRVVPSATDVLLDDVERLSA